MVKSRKCILIGIDGASPVFVERMVKDGRLPAFKRTLREGMYALQKPRSIA